MMMQPDAIDTNVTKAVILILGWISGHYLPADVGASLAASAPAIAAGVGALAAFGYGVYKAHGMKKVPVDSTAINLSMPPPPVGSRLDLTPLTGVVKVVGVLLIGFMVLYAASASASAQTNFQKGLNLPIPFPRPAGAPIATPTPEQVVRNLQTLTKADAAYALALAKQAGTPASNVRSQCWQAISDALPTPPSNVTEPPNPHLITNVEEIAELIDGLQPGSPLFVNCAGAAELSKMSVLNFINAIVTGAAGIAILAPKIP